MEFHDLGKHCSAENCGQQDYLPFTCSACDQVFCLHHRNCAEHSCSNINAKDKRVLECSKCNNVLRRPPGADHGLLLESHVASGCVEGVQKARSSKFACSAQGCRGSEFVKVACRTCCRNFCFRHRHEEDHKCEGIANTSLQEYLQLLKRVVGGARRSKPRPTAEDPMQLDRSGPETLKFGLVFFMLFGSFFFTQLFS